MIVDITKNGYEEGYLPKEGVGVFHPFFATANAAFRREALVEVGGFDPKCKTGEDVDVCTRIAGAGYELWFEPSARVTHYHRTTLRGLLKQWWQYGLGHAYLFKKQISKPRLQVYAYGIGGKKHSAFDIRLLADLPAPFHAMVFLTSYHAMHFCLAVAAGSAAFGWSRGALAFSVLAGLFALRYFGIQFNPKAPVRSLLFAGIRYLADGAYTLGGLIGGFKERTFYLEAVRSRKRG